jgi:DNA-directed RNA polymerase specialized sigma subunit
MKLFGKLPSTLQVCHSCDNPPCCNPNHLWVGTNKNNSDDMDAKGRRSKIRALGINHGNAKLTDEKVRLIRIRLKNGEEQRPIAKYFGVSQITISQISRGNIWKHVK